MRAPKNSTPRILLIYTGGTIGMIEDPVSHKLRPFDFDHLIDNVPKISKLNYDISNVSLTPIDSSDVTPEHWEAMARVIQDNYELYDGFVVLHGTDTMAYTASALSFMLENLSKPVIITGSQLPIGEVRTDGEENLITAIQIAASRDADGSPTVQEVAILFENYLWRGNRSTKMSADNFNAFRSNNYPALAGIGLGIHFNREALYRVNRRQPLRVNYGFDRAVTTIDLFPGLTAESLRYQLGRPGLKGVVMRTYGAGNSPTAEWFVDALGEAIQRGIVILNVTQCVNGGVHARYVSGGKLERLGVVCGRDITVEAALTKMMHLFARGMSASEVKEALGRSLCGEMTVQ